MDEIESSDNNGRKIESIVIVCLLLQWTREWIANIPAKNSLFSEGWKRRIKLNDLTSNNGGEEGNFLCVIVVGEKRKE